VWAGRVDLGQYPPIRDVVRLARLPFGHVRGATLVRLPLVVVLVVIVEGPGRTDIDIG
jgi:hypothetical protein